MQNALFRVLHFYIHISLYNLIKYYALICMQHHMLKLVMMKPILYLLLGSFLSNNALYFIDKK